MCGRYTTATEDEVVLIREIMDKISIRISTEDLKSISGKEIFPGNYGMVINNNQELCKMKWGFTKWDGKGIVFNTRSDNVKGRFFANEYLHHRCVIPCKNYFEWDKKKNKYCFKNDNDKIMFLAGLYKPEDEGSTYTIITKDAYEQAKEIHDRMPVIIEYDNVEKWLSNEFEINDLMDDQKIVEKLVY